MSKNVIVMSHKGFVLINLNEKKRTFIKKVATFVSLIFKLPSLGYNV